ncbi:MAG TPA: protein kinase, partial [Cryptosporangiaceae bacterium]|nr:protein kinase [Cryptosporangiaceae bacterium]
MTWQVPGYTTERMLGFGATGEVWVARDDVSGEAVALKRLRTGSGSLGADRERLRREGAILAAFRHPNVIGLRGVLGDAEGLVLVLDLASGGSLTAVLAAVDRLRAGEAVGFFAPVADALAAAHGQGLLHGDVSPGNLLLGADGTPLLADLGTARLAGDERSPVHATSRYLDPAVRAGGAPTTASDVYALAAVAAHALTAQPVADHGGGVQEWAERAHEMGVSARLVAALCAALATDPRRRPSAEEMGTSVRAACPPEPLDRLVAATASGVDERIGSAAKPDAAPPGAE